MAEQQADDLDPDGIYTGDPEALNAVLNARGDSVLSFCLELTNEATAVIAAAEAMARFRSALVTLGPSPAVDPDVLLLAATRHAGAAAADLDLLWSSARIQDRDPPCDMIPTMLAARATGQLSDADLERVAKHLWRCEGCRLVEAAFNRAEQAYREPTAAPSPAERAVILAALEGAAPVTVTTPQSPEVPEDHEPEIAQAPDADEAVAETPDPPDDTGDGADMLGDVEPPGFLDDATFDPRDRPTVLFDVLKPEDEDVPLPDTIPDAEVEGRTRRSATLVYSILALAAVLVALGVAVAVQGLPGQDDSPAATTPTTTSPPVDPVPTTPATG